MKKISDAELEVMKAIWDKEEITSAEIVEYVKECNWSDNTVRTLINRLIEKKVVGIKKRDGKSYIYVPLIKKQDYMQETKNKLIKQFFNNSPKEFLMFLCEDKDYCAEIKQAIEKHNR